MTHDKECMIRLLLIELLYDPSIKAIDFSFVGDFTEIHLNVGESKDDITAVYHYSREEIMEVMGKMIEERSANGIK